MKVPQHILLEVPSAVFKVDFEIDHFYYCYFRTVVWDKIKCMIHFQL